MVEVDGLETSGPVNGLRFELKGIESGRHCPAQVRQVDRQRIVGCGSNVVHFFEIRQVAKDVAHLWVDGAGGLAANRAREAAQRAGIVPGHDHRVQPERANDKWNRWRNLPRRASSQTRCDGILLQGDHVVQSSSERKTKL